jgi:hypothetical protein
MYPVYLGPTSPPAPTRLGTSRRSFPIVEGLLCLPGPVADDQDVPGELSRAFRPALS